MVYTTGYIMTDDFWKAPSLWLYETSYAFACNIRTYHAGIPRNPSLTLFYLAYGVVQYKSGSDLLGMGIHYIMRIICHAHVSLTNPGEGLNEGVSTNILKCC